MTLRVNSATTEDKRQQPEIGSTPLPQTSPTPSLPISRPAGTERKCSLDAEAEAEAEGEDGELEGVLSSKYNLSENWQENLPKEPQEFPSPARPVRLDCIPPVPISQSAGSKRKRSLSSEAAAEADELEGLPSASRLSPAVYLHEDPTAEADESERVHRSQDTHELPSSRYKLSKKNLLIFDTLSSENMNPTAKNASALKRTSSRRSTAQSETGTDGTQRPSVASDAYRYKNLAAVQILMHTEPPHHIQTAISRIIDAAISEERRAEIHIISQALRNDCLQNVRAQAGEDDFLLPFHIALRALNLEHLCLHRKAGWREELKPAVPQQSEFNSNFMSKEINDNSAPPQKSQQQSGRDPFTTPVTSMVQMSQETSTTPPRNFPADRSPTKNPCPDISMGIQLTSLVTALSSQDPIKVKARKFLTWLQNEMTQHEPDGLLAPMLNPVPAPRALDLTFPFAVVEGKAYSTGRQIFKAENQAAVSAACGLKIQLDLNHLVDGGETVSDVIPASSNTSALLFFSICTQGPIHELWVHWTISEDGVRTFQSKLLESCNALLLAQAEDFMARVNNVVVWGTGVFMKSVVERLQKVARKAKTW